MLLGVYRLYQVKPHVMNNFQCEYMSWEYLGTENQKLGHGVYLPEDPRTEEG